MALGVSEGERDA